MGRTVGLLRMSEHPGERRDFLPRLVRSLPRLGADEIVLETGYGQGLGLAPDAYTSEGDVRFAERDEVFAQDVVLVLRCPPDADLGKLRPGSTLVSMLHYVTRPTRNELLRDRGVVAVSLDAVTDDRGRRMIENLEITAWAGVEAAFRELALRWAAFDEPGRAPIRVTLLGSGALGAHAMHAATRYGNHDVRNALHRAGVPGVEVAVIDHDLSWHEEYMLGRLHASDLLMDATMRRPERAGRAERVAGGHALPRRAVGSRRRPLRRRHGSSDRQRSGGRAARVARPARLRGGRSGLGHRGGDRGHAACGAPRCRATPGRDCARRRAWSGTANRSKTCWRSCSRCPSPTGIARAASAGACRRESGVGAMDSGPRTIGVGFPRMHKEAAERRDYLPDLVAAVADAGAGRS